MTANRLLILLTILTPLLFLLAGKALALWHTPPTLPPRYGYQNRDFQIYGDDAAELHGSYIRSERPFHNGAADQPRPVVLFVADRNLDRDWNAPSFAFRSGKWLARFLGEQGIDSIRYDHRGIGKSVASAQSIGDFLLQTRDLLNFYHYARQQRYMPVILLAHGSGCSLALQTALEHELDIALFILLSCGHSGSLVEAWGDKLLFNMERKGVDKETLQIARQEWQLWLSTGERKSAEKAPPDLAAFRNALKHLDSKAMSSFLQAGRDIYPFQMISKIVLEKRGAILHVVGGADEERPPAAQESTLRFAARLQRALALEGRADLYRFLKLDHSNHFLKQSSSKATGLLLTLQRLNPFQGLDPSLLLLLQSTIDREGFASP